METIYIFVTFYYLIGGIFLLATYKHLLNNKDKYLIL